MTETEALAKMIAPGTKRPGKFRDGVIQIWLTRACDNSCFGCTQGSNLGGNPGMITVDQFEDAVLSLREYYGVVGVFGGNPAIHPKFVEICEVLRKHIPLEQRGLWCNNPLTLSKARVMQNTFNPRVSNLNVHLNKEAYALFKQGWPESLPFGLNDDCRHSPVHLAMKDVLKVKCPKCFGQGKGQWDHDTGCELPVIECDNCQGTGKVYDIGRAWELISGCDINQHWSAMIGVFRGQLRAWFCEVAGAQAMLHQTDPEYPDTGVDPTLMYLPEKGWESKKPLHSYTSQDPTPDNNYLLKWWELGMGAFKKQVRKHCHECGVPLRGYGELAMSGSSFTPIPTIPENPPREQTSATHKDVFKPKHKDREVEIVDSLEQLGTGRISMVTHYMQNAKV